MKAPLQMTRTQRMVEGALMVGLAYALSWLPHIELPFGGSVSLFATLPILIFSFRHGGRWGVGAAAVYSLLQMLQGMASIALCKTLGTMLLCALLDYILGYTILGFAGPIASRFKNRSLGVAMGVLITGAGRLAVSFLSGILLWRQYAPEGVPVWRYSLGYNASWCVPDVALVLVAAVLLSRVPALALCSYAQKTPHPKD